MNFRRFIEIIEAHDFQIHRHGATSHRQYRRVDGSGVVWIVTVAYHRIQDDIRPGTLANMIRQTGLRRKLFRR